MLKCMQLCWIQLKTSQRLIKCAVVLRYVDDIGVNERLLAIVNCSNSIGKGMLDLLKNILLLNSIDIKNCIANTTDGTANMQGEYNGYSTWLNKSSPHQVFVWCYSHVLNLVLLNVSKSPLAAASLFSLYNDLICLSPNSFSYIVQNS